MRAFFLLLTYFFLASSQLAYSQANTPRLSPQAEVSLLTSDPGYYIYEAFGHTSLRIHDPAIGLDLDYNYGSFDFFQENFYFNFLKGYMRYYLGVRGYDQVERNFLERGIQVRQQVLQLNAEEKQALFDRLQHNRLPANKYYYYDYFYDNCATRWRDILQDVLGPKLKWVNPQPDSLHSIRQLMQRYTHQHQWGQFGIDLALGARIDRPADFQTYLYLPDYLELALDHAQLHTDTATVPLVAAKRILVDPPVPMQLPDEDFTPVELAWLILAFGLLWSVFDWFRRRISTGFDLALLFVAGMAGLILSFFWLFTNHSTTAQNYNLLWAWPSHILVVLAWPWLRKQTWVAYYFGAIAVVLGGLLFLWAWVPQDLPEAMVPLVFLLFVRALMRWVRRQTIRANR